MPSIELFCVDQLQPYSLPEYSFALRADQERLSDRGWGSLFHDDFQQTPGWIYHLGSPRCKRAKYHGAYTGYDLLIRRSPEKVGDPRLKLKHEFVDELQELLKTLLTISPQHLVLFTTDYQFAYRPVRRYDAMSAEAFWRWHDADRLRLNSLYRIQEQ